VIRIRPARAGDAAAICAVHKAAVRRLCRHSYTVAQMQAWVGPRRPRDYARAMALWGERMLVALRRGRIVGFASVQGDALRALYVDPRRGRGTGLMLLRAAEAAARRRGVAISRLSASLNAVSFYLRAGYTVARPGEVRRSGVAIPVVEMVAASLSRTRERELC
jgi:GNAT superfamily N-acetyltransferase